MRSRRRTPRRRSAEEAAALVAEYEASGLTREAFCRSRRLSTSTLDYWRRRRRAARTAKNVIVPVTVVPTVTSAPYEIELTNGRRLRVDALFDAKSLTRLLAVVDPC